MCSLLGTFNLGMKKIMLVPSILDYNPYAKRDISLLKEIFQTLMSYPSTLLSIMFVYVHIFPIFVSTILFKYGITVGRDHTFV